MNGLSRLCKRFTRTQPVEFADDVRTRQCRDEIDLFLLKVLPEEEREFIDTSFISDEATIFDCSLAETEVLLSNCNEAYGVEVTIEELRQPLFVLVDQVKALSK